jgi:hypothetical protein
MITRAASSFSVILFVPTLSAHGISNILTSVHH